MAQDLSWTRSGKMDERQRMSAEVEARLAEIQRRHRGRIRWRIGQHTAELSLRALRAAEEQERPHPGPKSRRRKRHKRLL